MSRTVTALFDSRPDADAAVKRLEAAGIDIDHVQITDKSASNYTDAGHSTTQDRGFWASLKGAFLPDEDRHRYEEGVRRGGYLLTGEIDEDENATRAVQILEKSGPVDMDERSQDWQKTGWQQPVAKMAGQATGEQVIPIVEEQLSVGKREVDRGSVRVRSYVVEKPVQEQVELRSEKVDVERRRVDQPLSAADGDAFRERTIEMRETAEEAVIGKEARVVEEVVLNKGIDTRTETVSDTVRRTEIDVERDADRMTTDRTTAGTAGMGGSTTAGTAANKAGSGIAGVANEAVGNVKQGIGKMTGSDRLEADGEMQERRGEAQRDRS